MKTMAELGKVNELRVCRISPYSVYLDGGDLGEVMLLKDPASKLASVDDVFKAFVYIDIDDTLVGSTVLPAIQVGECASLQVAALTDSGAFLDWGLNSDLFLPRSEQMGETSVGSRCVVVALIDDNNQRMIASSRLYHHLPEEHDNDFKTDEKVSLIISQRTDLGFRAVINGTHLGMLYHDEIFSSLKVGDTPTAHIKALREDGKIDLILQRPSIEARTEIETKILDYLKQNKGVSHLTDKSPPAEIYRTFGISKKAYKHAIGGLYKSRLILLSKEEVRLVE